MQRFQPSEGSRSIMWFSFLVQVMTATTGCFPYYGYSSGPVVCKSMRFVNARTKDTVPDVLVIPHRNSDFGGGFFWSNDSTPFLVFGVGDQQVAHPFIHHPGGSLEYGDKFAGIVFILPPGMVGIGRGTNALFLVAPGYRAAHLHGCWADMKKLVGVNNLQSLEPLPAEGASAELEEIGALLEKDQLTKEEAGRLGFWQGRKEYTVSVRLTPEERELVRSFVARGLAELRADQLKSK
jgi:hypothetical protein